MVEHLVLSKVRSDASEVAQQEMVDALLGLKQAVPGIVEFTGGKNFSESEANKGFTHGFCVRFNDRAALDAYRAHPAHLEVVEKYVSPIVEDILVVDYER